MRTVTRNFARAFHRCTEVAVKNRTARIGLQRYSWAFPAERRHPPCFRRKGSCRCGGFRMPSRALSNRVATGLLIFISSGNVDDDLGGDVRAISRVRNSMGSRIRRLFSCYGRSCCRCCCWVSGCCASSADSDTVSFQPFLVDAIVDGTPYVVTRSSA